AVSCGEHLPERAQFVLMLRAHEEFGQIPLAVVYVLPRLPAGGGVHVEYRIYPMPPAPTDAVVYAPEVARLPEMPGVEGQAHRVEAVFCREADVRLGYV